MDKPKAITIRMTYEERELIKEAARLCKMSMNEFCLMVLKERSSVLLDGEQDAIPST